MKFTKNLITILICVSTIFSFIGCNDNKNIQTTKENIDKTVNENIDQPANEKIIIPYESISEMGIPMQGFAEVSFVMDKNKYGGIINSEGEIIYFEEGSRYSVFWNPIGKNVLYIKKGDEYILMNHNGTIISTFTKNDFDDVVACGNGELLVYKNQGTAMVENHTYGVINYKGEWEKPLMKQNKLHNYGEKFLSLGNGIFTVSDYFANDDYHVIYNTQINKVFLIRGGKIFGDNASNGIIYGSYGKEIGEHGTKRQFAGKTTDLPKYYKLNIDGSIDSIQSFNNASAGILLDYSDEYLKIINSKNVYNTNLNTSQIYSCHMSNGYTALNFFGADGRYYITAIDSLGKQMFEPKVCDNLSVWDTDALTFSNNIIIYRAENGYYEAIDINGKTIISKDSKYDKIQHGEGLFLVSQKRVFCHYVDINGNVITIKTNKY